MLIRYSENGHSEVGIAFTIGLLRSSRCGVGGRGGHLGIRIFAVRIWAVCFGWF